MKQNRHFKVITEGAAEIKWLSGCLGDKTRAPNHSAGNQLTNLAK